MPESGSCLASTSCTRHVQPNRWFCAWHFKKTRTDLLGELKTAENLGDDERATRARGDILTWWQTNPVRPDNRTREQMDHQKQYGKKI